MSPHVLRALALILVLSASAGRARGDAGDDKARLEARALLQSGNAFYDKGAYDQALDLFRAAYTRYPSTKLLFNIGRTLDAMGRSRDAAIAFDQYLARPDADAGRRTEILAILRRIEGKLGKLVLKDIDAATRIAIDGEPIAAGGAPARVDPGDHVVHVEKPGFLALELTVSVKAGEEKTVDVKLSPEPPAAPQPTRVAVRTQPTAPPAGPVLDESGGNRRGEAPAIARRTEPRAGAGAPSPLAITVRGVFDQKLAGAAVQPGVELAVDRRLSVVGAATLGPTLGGYLGARARVLDGTLRPLIAAGVPMFAFHGARFGLRGAAGVEAAVTGRFSVSLELGIEHYFVKAGDMLRSTVLAPAAAINARL